MYFRRSVLLVLSAAAVALLLLNAFYVWDWADDYAIKQALKKFSLWEFQWSEYMGFDGRSLNLGYFFSRACLKSEVVYLASLIGSILILCSAYCLYKLFSLSNEPWYGQFAVTVFITGLLWLASFFVLSNTLYYQTCTLYVVELVHLVFAYYLLNNWPQARWKIFLSYFLFFMLGMSSPGLVIAFLVVLFIEFMKERGEDSVLTKRYAWIFLAMVLGLMLVLLSPGTANRLQFNVQLDAKPFENIHNFYFFIQQIVATLYHNCSPLVWVLLALGLYMGLMQANEQKGLWIKLYFFRWFFAAAISVVFYFPKGYLFISSSRLSLQFIWFVVLFFLSNYKRFGRPINGVLKQQILILGLLLFILILGNEGLNAKHSQWKVQNRIV